MNVEAGCTLLIALNLLTYEYWFSHQVSELKNANC
jgi:hypothetical protein